MKTNNNSSRIPRVKLIKIISFLLSFSLLIEQSGFAQVAGQIDISGHFAQLRQALTADKFRPLHLRYLSYDNLNNDFELLLDKGDIKNINPGQIESTSKKLLQYFAIGVTLPNDAFWVNLRPDAPDHILDPGLAQTEVGKVMLESDLQLKKDIAKYTSPDTAEGKEYWEKLYKKAAEILGYDNITIPTITRPWIVPDEIIIRETKDNAYIYKATLKVMLEQDYLKNSATYNFKDERLKQLNGYSSELIRNLIIPKLTREINSSKRYAALRQVYYSLILAQWFKQRFRGRGGFYSWLIDRRDLTGLTSHEAWSKDSYFKQYQQSFKDGEYNFKETVPTPFGQSIRSYFSGGINYTAIVFGEGSAGVKLIEGSPLDKPLIPDYAVMAKVGSNGEIKVASEAMQNQGVIGVAVPETQQDLSASVPAVHNIGKKSVVSQFLTRIALFAAVLWLSFAHPQQSRAADQIQQDNQQRQEQVQEQPQGQETASFQEIIERIHNMQKTLDKIDQRLDNAEKTLASINNSLTTQPRQVSQISSQKPVETRQPVIVPPKSENLQADGAQPPQTVKILPAKEYAGVPLNTQAVSNTPVNNPVSTNAVPSAAAVTESPLIRQQAPKIAEQVPANSTSAAAVTGNPLTQQQAPKTAEQSVGQPSASISDSKALVPVEQQSFQEISKYLKSGPYYEIIKMGDPNDLSRLTQRVYKLEEILKVHDDRDWKGLTPDALVKMTYPLGVSDPKPTFNMEITVGKILEFLHSGFVHIKALYDEPEPSNRAAAAYALGNLKPVMDKKFSLESKRGVINNLFDALQDKNANVRAAALWALIQYNDTSNPVIGGKDVDVRIKRLKNVAIYDDYWLARYYAVMIIESSKDPRITDPLVTLLSREKHPLVLDAALEASFNRDSPSALLPAIQSIEQLKFDTSGSEALYYLDSRVLNHVAQGLVNFGNKNAESRRQAVLNFINAIKQMQVNRELNDKYGIVNGSYLPVFKTMVTGLKISRSDIEQDLSGVSPEIANALLHIIEPNNIQITTPPSLQTTEVSYQNMIVEYKTNNPAVTDEIKRLENSRDHTGLGAVIIFDHENSARRALAVDALSRMDNLQNIRPLLLGLKDSHPFVRDASARALRNYVCLQQFIYDGNDGELAKALRSAVSGQDWMAVAYLMEDLRLLGNSDALSLVAKMLEADNKLISRVVGESLGNFGQDAQAQEPVILKLLDPKVSEIGSIINALDAAKGLLRASDDALLVNSVVNILVYFPANPEADSSSVTLREKGLDCLRLAKNDAVGRLTVLYQEKKGRDFPGANNIRGLLQELLTQDEFSQWEASLKPAKNQSEATSDAGPMRLSESIGTIFDINAPDSVRFKALDWIQTTYAGTANIELTKQLLTFIKSDGHSDIIKKAIAAVLDINNQGGKTVFPIGHNPMAEAFESVVMNDVLPADVRSFAIDALGRTPSSESETALQRLVNSLSFKDRDLIIKAVNTERTLLASGGDRGLVNSLISIMVDNKLGLSSEAIRTGTADVEAAANVISTLQQKKTDAFIELRRLLRSELSPQQRPDGSVVPASESKINRILDLAMLIDEGKAEDLKGLVISGPAGAAQNNNVITLGANNQMSLWKESLALLGQLSEKNPPDVRIKALLQLKKLGGAWCFNPDMLKAVREALGDQNNEEVRMAAINLYCDRGIWSIYYAPGMNNVDVDSLSYGLDNPVNKMSYQERLLRITALGQSGSPYAVKPLLSTHYILLKLYPYMQTDPSLSKPKALDKAIETALRQAPKEEVASQATAILEARLDAGNLNIIEDSLPMSITEELVPGASGNFMNKLGFEPVATNSVSFANEFIAWHNAPDLKRQELEIKLKYFEKVFTFLNPSIYKVDNTPYVDRLMKDLFDKDNPVTRCVAALELGRIKETRAVLPLLLGMQDTDANVSAACAWALSNFKNSTGEQDLRIPYWSKLSDKKDPLIRANVAIGLGTSGDPRAIELLKGFISNDEDNESAIFAVHSARNLIERFKNEELVRELLKVCLLDRDGILSHVGIGYPFGPVGQAAYSELVAIGNQEELRPLLLNAIDNIGAEQFSSELGRAYAKDVLGSLRDKFSDHSDNKIQDIIHAARHRLYYYTAVGLGMLSFSIGTFLFLLKRIFFKKPRALSKIDKYKEFILNPDSVGYPGIHRDQDSLFTAEKVRRYKEGIRMWEDLLEKDKLNAVDIDKIKRFCWEMKSAFPIVLSQPGCDFLSLRMSMMNAIGDKLDITLSKIVEDIRVSHDSAYVTSLVSNARDCITLGHYFEDCLVALVCVSDLRISSDYPSSGNGNSDFYRKHWGIDSLYEVAVDDLAYLLSEKIYPKTSTKEGYRALIEVFVQRINPPDPANSHYSSQFDIKPYQLGVRPNWFVRKRMSRIGAVTMSAAIGGITGAVGFHSIFNQFSMEKLLLYSFSVVASTFMGYIISTGISWHYIKKGWKETRKEFVSGHKQFDMYNNLIDKYFSNYSSNSGRGPGGDSALGAAEDRLERAEGLYSSGAPKEEILVLLNEAIKGDPDGSFIGLEQINADNYPGLVEAAKTDIGRANKILTEISVPSEKRPDRDAPKLQTSNTRKDNGDLGGIDFSSISSSIQVRNVLSAQSKNPASEMNPIPANDPELKEIEKLLHAEIVPNLNRIKEYLAEGSKYSDLNYRVQNVRKFLADTFRIEEMNSNGSGFDGYVILLESIEGNDLILHPQAALSKLKIWPKEFVH